MDLGIAGKTALVLGGSRGIGRATARELALAGANIAIVARNQATIDEAVAEMQSLGVKKAVGISTDLFEIDNYEGMVRACTEQVGPPDIAIYNADAPGPGGFYDIDEDMLAFAYRIVVLNYSRFLRLVLPHMREQKWGRIVTIGSAAAKCLTRQQEWPFLYILANATRVAAATLAKTVSSEVAIDGVTINSIGTGYVVSDQQQAWTQDRADDSAINFSEFEARMLAGIPVGRPGRVEEQAALAAFLCSARASYTTGETILCDGGKANSIL